MTLPPLTDLHWIRPDWLYGLLLLPPMLWLLQRRWQGQDLWRHVIDENLRPWMLSEAAQRRKRVLVLTALGLGWAMALMALAGPSLERRPQPTLRLEDAIVIVLDLSQSMYAQDIRPSRLVRARLKVADLLAQYPDSQFGLLAYAGDSHVVVPLTFDTRTIHNLLPALDPEIMPTPGSRAQDAIAMAVEQLQGAAVRQGHILLITDEIINTEAVINAAGTRYPVSVLGMGTQQGAPIPRTRSAGGGFLRDGSGELIMAGMDPGPLQRLARATGGAYSPFTKGDEDIRRLLGEGNLAENLTRSEGPEREYDTWIDLGYWLVLPLLLLMLFSFRRGMVTVLTLTLCSQFLAPSVQAAEWQDWFLRPDQQGYKNLQEGDTQQAIENFQDPNWRAIALHRAGKHAAASDSFAGEDALAYYNRCTVLAHAGSLQAAQAACQQALKLAPDHEDARHNLDIIERLLQQQQQDEQADRQQSPDGDQEQSRQSQSPSEDGQQTQPQSDAGEQQTASNPGAQPEEQTPAQDAETDSMDADETAPELTEAQAEDENQDASATDEAMAMQEREQEQALQQWLRRIPDRPGALLQRKFRYETQQRQRRGVRPAPHNQQTW